MKTNKIKMGFIALVLGGFIAFTQSAFSPATKVLDTEWTFMGNSSSDVINGFQYELTGAPPTACNSGVALPCKLTTPSGIATQGDLDAYILSEYEDDPAQVTAAADSKRQAQ